MFAFLGKYTDKLEYKCDDRITDCPKLSGTHKGSSLGPGATRNHPKPNPHV